MDNIIRLKGISFYAYHGVFRHEQNVGGKFEADIEIHTDFRTAAMHDALGETVDYESVYKTVIEMSDSKKYYLLESLAMSIVNVLFTRFSIISAMSVRLRKNNPPIGGVLDSVEVEIQKSRTEFHEENNAAP